MEDLDHNLVLIKSKTRKIFYYSTFYVLSSLLPALLDDDGIKRFMLFIMLPYLILGIFGCFSIIIGKRSLFRIYGILAAILSVLNIALIILSIIALTYLVYGYNSQSCEEYEGKMICVTDEKGAIIFLMILCVLIIIIGALFAILTMFSAKHGIQCSRLMIKQDQLKAI